MPVDPVNNFDKGQLSTISALFAYKQILKFDSRSISGSNDRVSSTLMDVLNSYYNLLFENYRCEYIYKNEIVNQILLKNHTTKAKLYTEVEIHDSKADVVIINGTSSVYEIKTELDTLDRLPKQLAAYKLVFDKVYVVTHYSKLEAVLSIVKPDIGIMILGKNGKLRKLRNAKSNKQKTKPQYTFNLLHREEYIRIIRDHYGSAPDVSPVKIFQACKKLFTKLSPELAHDYMVEALRNRGIPLHRENLLNSLPYSLKLIGASGKLTKKECEGILQKLEAVIIN